MFSKKYKKQLKYMAKIIKVNSYCLVGDTDIVFVESKYKDSLGIPTIVGHSCINGQPLAISMNDYIPKMNNGAFLLPLTYVEYLSAKALWNNSVYLRWYIKNTCYLKYKKFLKDN